MRLDIVWRVSSRQRIAAVAALALVLVACRPGLGGPAIADDERLEVVATTTVIADLVSNVGGERVAVAALVPPGGEPHTFDPSPSDVTRLESAAIVFANGLGLDDWLADLVSDAGTEAPIVELGEDLPGVEYRDAAAHEEGAEHEEDAAPAEGIDPHVWLNVAYARAYVERIADELSAIHPDGAEAYRANAEAYAEELDELDAYARDTLGAIPADGRAVISFHEAFGYFADAYGLTIVDTVVDAPGQDPSAGEVAALIDEIRANDVRAILAESQFPTDLVDRIAEETGVVVVADLYSDSVGEPPIDTYVAMISFDVDAIAGALR
jgi:ABC-type Zn uptake system ZnuABC Zn-binding protein ZnuA